jgi:uncharacterized protein YjbI with pentapeptide repeats
MIDQGLKLDNAWAKPKVKKAELFKGIVKIIKDLSTSDCLSLPGDILDTVDSIKFEDNPGQVGWKLISRSMIDALLNLIVENDLSLLKKEIVVDHLDNELDKLLEDEAVYINVDFFKEPHKLLLLQKAQPVLTAFLQLFGFDDGRVNNIMERFPIYFIFSLETEWRKNYKYYEIVSASLHTPFNTASKKENEWSLYSKWIIKEIDRPVFSESFSLRQIYIPLRAYYRIKDSYKKQHDHFDDDTRIQAVHKKIVVDLKEELLQWVEKGKKDDAIRIIRGGPGYGKSCFLKMFGAELAARNKRVIFIPLHRFEVKDDLTVAVQSFLNYDKFLNFDPFEEDRLILLFDGLDELSMQGSLLADIASQFIREVEKKVNNYNHQQLHIQVMISGRDVIVQQNENEFRKDGQILSVLPYYLNGSEKNELTDTNGLLQEDQRHVWWKKYGSLKQKDYDGLPANLQSKELNEITAQPLLNYLVALSYERGEIVFSKETNLNEIYNDLLEAVFTRGYSESKIFHVIKTMSLDHFTRILEEIAIAAWHGNGRTTTVADIEQHFRDSGIQKMVDEFIKHAEKGVVSLLVAFYFRQAGQTVNGSRTFEFTHKSFGEYLTARRIVKKIFLIEKKLHENEANYDEGWNIKTCLTEWIKLFGPKTLDEDLIKFIKNEISIAFRHDADLLKRAQQAIIKLINQVLKEGMPLEEIAPRPAYYFENEMAINGEKALLIMLSCFADFTDQVSNIRWPGESSFGEWIGRLMGQRESVHILILRHLNHLNLDYCVLDLKDLFHAYFRRSSFKSARLAMSILVDTDLNRANLENAILQSTNLMGARLIGADLRNAELLGANLRDANLEAANLTGANLIGAKLKGANLKGTNLEDAKLEGANLKRANLLSANLDGANLEDANLEDANLEDTNLKGANLKNTILDPNKPQLS